MILTLLLMQGCGEKSMSGIHTPSETKDKNSRAVSRGADVSQA